MIKIVVIAEHTLGYIYPETPNQASILSTSILKGSTFNPHVGAVPIGGLSVRPANLQDFEDYRVSSEGYVKDREYDFIRDWNTNYDIHEVHISTIKAGDTIISKDGYMRTINQNNLGGDSFIGRTINGDSYKCGHELVKKVVFKLLNKK
jgi:hypothetical protein